MHSGIHRLDWCPWGWWHLTPHQFEICQGEFATVHEGFDPDERGSPRNNDPYETCEELTQEGKLKRRQREHALIIKCIIKVLQK